MCVDVFVPCSIQGGTSSCKLITLRINHLFWVFVFINWRLLERSWAPLSFVLWVVAKLVCFCLCLLDAIVGLYAMDEKCSMTFSLEVRK